MIGAHDLWLAATCIAHGLTMITAKVREFTRIPGLAVEVRRPVGLVTLARGTPHRGCASCHAGWISCPLCRQSQTACGLTGVTGTCGAMATPTYVRVCLGPSGGASVCPAAPAPAAGDAVGAWTARLCACAHTQTSRR